MGLFNLIQDGKPIWAAAPKDTTGAAYNGDYINMSLIEELWILISQGAWAGGTPAVTLGQGTTAAGGTTVALTAFEAWTATGLTVDTPAAVTVTAGTFNLTATANSFTLIRARANQMTEGYKYLRAEVASPGANADLVSMVYIGVGLKYHGKYPPTSIV